MANSALPRPTQNMRVMAGEEGTRPTAACKVSRMAAPWTSSVAGQVGGLGCGGGGAGVGRSVGWKGQDGGKRVWFQMGWVVCRVRLRRRRVAGVVSRRSCMAAPVASARCGRRVLALRVAPHGGTPSGTPGELARLPGGGWRRIGTSITAGLPPPPKITPTHLSEARPGRRAALGSRAASRR